MNSPALGTWLAQRPCVRRILETAEEPRPLAWPPSPRVVFGLFLIGLSYTICWPVIACVGFVAARLDLPLLLALGAPAIWGFSHLVWMAGMALVGAEAAKKTAWLWRMGVRAVMRRLGAQVNQPSSGEPNSASRSRSSNE